MVVRNVMDGDEIKMTRIHAKPEETLVIVKALRLLGGSLSNDAKKAGRMADKITESYKAESEG